MISGSDGKVVGCRDWFTQEQKGCPLLDCIICCLLLAASPFSLTFNARPPRQEAEHQVG
jgi:hypothetical protein